MDAYSVAANATNRMALSQRPQSSIPRFHISNMPLCYNVGKYEAGDTFGIIAYYNLTEHPPMIGSHGGLEQVMGISIVYLDNDEKLNPYVPGLEVTTAPITGITITGAPPQQSAGPPANETGISGAEPEPTSVKPSNIISTIPIVTTITVATLGYSTILTIHTSVVVTVVPATGVASIPIKTTPSQSPAPTSPPPSPSPSTSALPPPVSSSPSTITSPPSTTASTSNPNLPWWLTSRPRPGLVPAFTQQSGSWIFTYTKGTRSSVTAKVTTPALIIPIPLIFPSRNPTIYNPFWTLTIPLGLPYTTYVKVKTALRVLPTQVPTDLESGNWNRAVQRVVQEAQDEDGENCETGYPCGGRVVGLPSLTVAATPTRTE